MTRDEIKQAAREIYANATVNEWAEEVAKLCERANAPLLQALRVVKDNAVFKDDLPRATLDEWIISKCRAIIADTERKEEL